jgi:hypothetical protein
MSRHQSLAVLVAIAVGTSCNTRKPPEIAQSITMTAQHGVGLSGERRAQYSRYLKDTLASLESMRGKTGLIKDSIWVCWDRDLKKPNFRDTEELTSPTNIGLDIILLTQRTLVAEGTGEDAASAQRTLRKVMHTLDSIPYHHANGMFFRTYWPDTGKPADINLSSVDNLHLAFGLWVVAKSFRDADPGVSAIAKRLFERMDFSDYFNLKTNLIGGNMRPIGEDPSKREKGDPQGEFIRDAFDYKYFGSEARSLYALGWALGLYRKAKNEIADFDQRLLTDGIEGTLAEIATLNYPDGPLRVLRTWDGGGFQALLPAVLVREELYSPILRGLHRNYAQRLLNDAESLGVPASHSASAFGVRGLRLFRSGDKKFNEGLTIYNGAAGHIDMVATMHEDVKDPRVRAYWDLAYTPHPAFMAASFARDSAGSENFAERFKQNETLSSLASCVCMQDPNLQSADRVAVMPAPNCECKSRDDLPNMRPGPDGIIGEPNLCSVAPTRSEGGDLRRDHLYEPGWGIRCLINQQTFQL